MNDNTIDWTQKLKTPQGLDVELLKIRKNGTYNYQCLTGTRRKTLCQVNKQGLDERGTRKVAFNAYDPSLDKKQKPKVVKLRPAQKDIDSLKEDLSELRSWIEIKIDQIMESHKTILEKIDRFEKTPIAEIKRDRSRPFQGIR